MNLSELFDSFKKYVDSMDDAAVLESIHAAIEHTSRSSILDGSTEIDICECEKSSTQEIQTFYMSENQYGFVSVGLDIAQNTYILSGREGSAA